MATTTGTSVEQILGDEAEDLLSHRCETIPVERLTLPGPTWVDDIMTASDRPTPVLRSLQTLFDHGRLGGHRLRLDPPGRPGHRALGRRRPSRRTPTSSTPRTIVELAIAAECNAVATTLGVLGIAARKYAHRIPFLLKLNHNEFLSYPNKPTTRSCSRR